MDALKSPRKPGERRPNPTPEETQERERLRETRVEYIADMMRELRFRSGITTKSLADAWDLPRGYVNKLAVEASARVRSEVVQDDHIVSTISMNLERLIGDAVDSGDKHTIVNACKVWATVTGAGAATKVQLQQDLTSLTPEQLQARKAEIIARLTGKAPAVVNVPALPAADNDSEDE